MLLCCSSYHFLRCRKSIFKSSVQSSASCTRSDYVWENDPRAVIIKMLGKLQCVMREEEMKHTWTWMGHAVLGPSVGKACFTRLTRLHRLTGKSIP